jgi:hypothetical protein
MKCPYCLSQTIPSLEKREFRTVYVCSNKSCSAEIHRDYVEQINTQRGFIGLVGFSGHGKTSYLTILFYLLRQLTRLNTWNDFYFQTLDENTHRIIYNVVNILEKKSELPESTPQNFPLPSLIYFKNIYLFGDYFISFYDTAGAVYEDINRITNMGRFVAGSDVVFFIISINDCGTDFITEMERLLDIYVNAVYNHLRINLRENQHLIIVLTKGDMILNLPDNIKIFLQEGSYKWYKINNKTDSNIKSLKNISEEIKIWLEKMGGRGFIRRANDKFKSVEFTLVSSTGAAPSGIKLSTKLKPEDPKRILDPFLWALEKISKKRLIRNRWWELWHS